MSLFVAFFSGLIFSLGLGISGMTQPQKVQAFLDIFGNWNPALALVMVGAIGVHLIFYRWTLKKEKPLLSKSFEIPKSQEINKRLIFGAAIFGIGWGLAGFCPGPAIASLASLNYEVFLFVIFMIIGMKSRQVLLK